jgi:hypothetical protein
MTIPVLLLGPIQFTAFELPAAITWGGAQSLIVHRLPGGDRIIDAMGRDDAPITWSGIFTGPDATLRAHALDLMRAEGAVWPLTWQDFFYSVVISRFEADYRRPNWIPYRITCTVLRDEASALVETALSPAQSVANDLATAATYSGSPATSDAFASGPADLTTAPDLAGTAAQQAAASGYFARAARNSAIG